METQFNAGFVNVEIGDIVDYQGQEAKIDNIRFIQYLKSQSADFEFKLIVNGEETDWVKRDQFIYNGKVEEAEVIKMIPLIEREIFEGQKVYAKDVPNVDEGLEGTIVRADVDDRNDLYGTFDVGWGNGHISEMQTKDDIGRYEIKEEKPFCQHLEGGSGYFYHCGKDAIKYNDDLKTFYCQEHSLLCMVAHMKLIPLDEAPPFYPKRYMDTDWKNHKLLKKDEKKTS